MFFCDALVLPAVVGTCETLFYSNFLFIVKKTPIFFFVSFGMYLCTVAHYVFYIPKQPRGTSVIACSTFVRISSSSTSFVSHHKRSDFSLLGAASSDDTFVTLQGGL